MLCCGGQQLRLFSCNKARIQRSNNLLFPHVQHVLDCLHESSAWTSASHFNGPMGIHDAALCFTSNNQQQPRFAEDSIVHCTIMHHRAPACTIVRNQCYYHARQQPCNRAPSCTLSHHRAYHHAPAQLQSVRCSTLSSAFEFEFEPLWEMMRDEGESWD